MDCSFSNKIYKLKFVILNMEEEHTIPNTGEPKVEIKDTQKPSEDGMITEDE